MVIYIDNQHKCHATNTGTLTPVETDFFEGKCPAFIEGYKHFPADGTTFPWKPFHELEMIQAEYEKNLLPTIKAENADLVEDLAILIEELYETDMERIND